VASNYPSSLDSFDTIASDKKTSDSVGGRTHRDMHNDLGDAIEAVQGELGTDPAGASATVKARFEAIEANDWVTSARILDGTIVNADINSAAAIARTKLAQPAYAAKTSTYTATTADDVLNVTSGTFTIDLPAANTCAGKTFKVKNSGTGVVTLDGNSSETVEGVATFPLGPGAYVEITSTGAAWIITGGVADTGWRDVIGSIDADWQGASSNPMLRLRRRGSTVFFLGRIRRLTASGAVNAHDGVYTAPSGFTPPTTAIGPAQNDSRATIAGWVTGRAGSNVVAVYWGTTGNYAADEFVTFSVSWETSDAWPTTLP